MNQWCQWNGWWWWWLTKWMINWWLMMWYHDWINDESMMMNKWWWLINEWSIWINVIDDEWMINDMNDVMIWMMNNDDEYDK